MAASSRVLPEIRNVSRYAYRRANTHLFGVVKQTDLKHVKNIRIQFDPFHEHAKSVRDFHFYVTAPKVRQTGSCNIKVDVKSDRSDPQIEINYNDGQKLLFKTKNLNTYEIFMQLKNIHIQKELEAR